MIICLTGTISPNKNIKDLKVMDFNIRLKEYLDNILYLITQTKIEKICFCENSNFGNNEIFSVIKDIATLYNKNFEYISFQGDETEVIKKGRGFGEQEILEYFIKNSKLLKGEKNFYKLTGRYKVININSIIKIHKKYTNIFINMSPFERRCNTAFYKVNIKFFQNNIMGCGKYINDRKGRNFQIEGIYKKILKDHKKNINCFKTLPLFEANTGSGYKLRKNFFKDTCKQIFNLFGFYKI